MTVMTPRRPLRYLTRADIGGSLTLRIGHCLSGDLDRTEPRAHFPFSYGFATSTAYMREMGQTVAILTAVLAGVVGAIASPDGSMLAEVQFGEHKGCPCLTTHGYPNGTESNETEFASLAAYDCFAEVDGTCYPPHYGLATCRHWDQGESLLGDLADGDPSRQREGARQLLTAGFLALWSRV